jgi:CheY-like chemotaxis protein
MAATILIVDDNEDVLQISARILRGKGYHVLTATSGPDALGLAVERLPSCVLLDIMMPEMSGLDVLSKLKKNPSTSAIPVILVTARIRDEDVLAGYKEGADYYITKPFSGEQLLYGIRLVLGQNPTVPAARESDA